MAKPKRNMVRINLFMQAPVAEGLKRLGAIRGETFSDMVRTASRRYLIEELGKVAAEQEAVYALSDNGGEESTE